MAQKTGCLFLICLQTNKLFIPYMFTNKQVVYSLNVYKQTSLILLLLDITLFIIERMFK